jgi:cell division protease FtsH
MSKQNFNIQITNSSHEEIIKKKQLLEGARIKLKEEFVGIDKSIDDIIHSIESWFIFPEGQIRPTVINLFGLTGVGKTSLVTRLMELINMEKKLYRFDIGDYTGDSNKLKYDFSNKLKGHDIKPIVLVFDEFQLGRTMSERGDEIDRSNLRALWDLLDSGKIDILNENYYTHKVFSLVLKLQHCIKNDVESKNGIITKNQKFHNDIFFSQVKEGKKLKLQNEDGENVTDTKNFVPDDMLYNIRQIFPEHSINSGGFIKKRLSEMNHVETVQFLSEALDNHMQPKTFDYSQSLIFVIGNLDEVYYMSGIIDPDDDADLFYENSLDISITDVKEALKNRFRVEQIARLGNNYVIYPAFSSEAYRQLISLELNKFIKRSEKKFPFLIELDKSINEIVYKEGVFPTQGTRPVFTTINNMIESYIPKILSDIIIDQLKVLKIQWSFNDKTSKYEVVLHTKESTKTLFYDVLLKLDNLRKSTKDDLQANTAVHESGHAVVSAMHLQLIPEEIVSKTAGCNLGFCRIEMPDLTTKELVEKDICVGLGGYAAEKLIFGEKNLSAGAVSDIKKVTEKAVAYVKFYGMHDLPIAFGVESSDMNHNHAFEDGTTNKAIKNLIKKCINTTTKVLKKEKTLLLKISEYLSENHKMDKVLMENYIKRYSSSRPVFRSAKKYYNFKEQLDNQLKRIPKTRNKLTKKPLK